MKLLIAVFLFVTFKASAIWWVLFGIVAFLQVVVGIAKVTAEESK